MKRPGNKSDSEVRIPKCKPLEEHTDTHPYMQFFESGSLSLPLDHLLDSGEGPVNFLFCDYERRGDPNDMVMRLFAQNSFLHQCLTIGTRLAVEFNSDPEPTTA